MKYYIDISIKNLNKYGEILCGDTVEVIQKENGMIIVLADGLGSGVKANILSTLTAKIAATMMKEGSPIHQTVDTLINTLPKCSIRQLAYSTFTIVDILNDGRVYIAEYDNPPFFLLRENNAKKQVLSYQTTINSYRIVESFFSMNAGDTLVIASDGIIHAGIGASLNFGWQWENIDRYLSIISNRSYSSENISTKLIDTANNLYNNMPGDDSTVVVLKYIEKKITNVFAGPPKDIAKDTLLVDTLLNTSGKKAVCGGTTANIVSRLTNKDLEVDLSTITPSIPPIAKMDGVDLVTEGVLTLSNTLSLINDYIKNKDMEIFNENNGASMLAKLLVKDSTHINFWLGRALNSAHQNPDLPIDLSIKIEVVEKIAERLDNLDKVVKVNYFD